MNQYNLVANNDETNNDDLVGNNDEANNDEETPSNVEEGIEHTDMDTSM